MKRRKLSAGEVRFRIGKQDLERIEWLLKYHPQEYTTISALIRALIAREHEALTNVHILTRNAKNDL